MNEYNGNQPHDAMAEMSVLGEAMRNGKVSAEVSALIAPTDMYRPILQQIAQICWDLTDKDVSCNPVTVLDEYRRRRLPTSEIHVVAELAGFGHPGTHHARIIRECAARRRLIATADRLAQLAVAPEMDPWDTAASVSVTTGQLAENADPIQPEPLTDVVDFAAGSVEFDWLVPGLLERGDRLLITGSEGSGKTWLIRQFAVTVAAGLHPFSGARIIPRSVLLIDLENGTRHLRRGTVRLLEHAARIGRAVPRGRMSIESLPAGIDLTRVDDEAWLFRLCEAAKPDVLVIGPLYRMHAADMTQEEPARQLTRVLDAIRAKHHCAVLVETHAGHGAGMGVRDLRPVGSSLFRRWPEFGYGLRTNTTDDQLMDLVSWRGARDERAWPSHLRRGGSDEWPFVEAMSYAPAVGQYWNDVARKEHA